MRAGKLLIISLSIVFLFSIGLGFARIFFNDLLILWQNGLYTILFLVLFFTVLDGLRVKKESDLEITRNFPHNTALGVKSEVILNIRNLSRETIKMIVTDDCPESMTSLNSNIELELSPESEKSVSYFMLPLVRGEAVFRYCYIRVKSPWGFWTRLIRLEEETRTRVYPNFIPIARSMLIGIDKQIKQMGVHLVQKRGEGLDFHQLREFREGDALRQVDWKATIRHRKPISRDYQEERDQDIIFVLDSSRRLRTKESHNELSHFDISLNATLLASYIALHQGDSVGVLTFGNETRWIKPCKGKASITHLLNQLYDLHSGTQYGDLVSTAEELLKKHRKRSLVILISSLMEEDLDDLLRVNAMLSKRHIVMIASLRETVLGDVLKKPVNDFNQALSYSGIAHHLEKRARFFGKVRKSGAVVVDSDPQQLHKNLVEEYLKIKRSGRL